MASVVNRPNGHKWVQFIAIDRKRQTLRLGKVTRKTADETARRVEFLLESKAYGRSPEMETLRWVAELPADTHSKLAAVGLVSPRAEAVVTRLGAFIVAYMADRKDAKPATKEVWGQGQTSLLEHFKADEPISSVTPGDADRYKTMLAGKVGRNGKKLAPMTIRKRLQFATMIFRAAFRRRLITENPFDGVSVKAQKAGKKRFITVEQTNALLRACPDHHWRMIVTLARYGGLRCPSEVLSLKWTDIDWEKNLITVPSPKTEHHAGKETRVIPLWPQLKKALDESYFEAEKDGATYVVDERFRKAAIGKDGWRNINLRTTFEKIISRAGLTKWPRLFHALRASRQTELTETEPSHVVCAWMGNSEDVARDHYLLKTEEQVAKSMDREQLRMTDAKKAAEAKAEALKHACDDSPRFTVLRSPLESSKNTGNSRSKADGEGFEGIEVRAEPVCTYANGGFVGEAKGEAFRPDSPSTDDVELSVVITAWTSLDSGKRAAILAIVKSQGT